MGFEHPYAIALAHLAARLVDAPKAGLHLRQDKWKKTLTILKTKEPEYIKPQGQRRHFTPDHVMDILVLQVIPEFLEQVLTSYNENVRGDAKIPMDEDIKGFYLTIKKIHPTLVEKLTTELLRLREKWKNCIARMKNDQNKEREDVTCSPKKKVKTISFPKPLLDLVLLSYAFVNIRTISVQLIKESQSTPQLAVLWWDWMHGGLRVVDSAIRSKLPQHIV